MYKTYKTVKHLFYLLAVSSVGFFSLTLSSCGTSSPAPAVIRPGNWEQVANFSGSGRSGAASFVIDGKLYVGGGFTAAGTRVQDWWQFDPVRNGWVKKTNFPGSARSAAVAFTISNKGYVGLGTGQTTGVYFKDFWEFDPAGNSGAGSWRRVKDFGDPITETGRIGSIAFSISNRGFVGAGATIDANATNDLWEYKPATDTWEQRTGVSFKRVNASVMTIGNFAYVVGGTNNAQTIRNVEQYDPTNDTWTQKLSLNQRDASGNKIDQPSARELAATFTIDGFGYIAGGGVNGSALADVWQYNPTTDRWIQYYSFNNAFGGVAREAAVGFGIGNFGYVTTGRNGNFRLDDTLKFDPTGVPIP
jgi:N-acetylneuraminic acid mutarotase